MGKTFFVSHRQWLNYFRWSAGPSNLLLFTFLLLFLRKPFNSPQSCNIHRSDIPTKDTYRRTYQYHYYFTVIPEKLCNYYVKMLLVAITRLFN